MSGTEDPKAPEPNKVEKLAEDAALAGKKFLETDAGKKVAEVSETAFAKAEELAKQALESETGKKAAAKAKELAGDAAEAGRRFMDSDTGKQVAEGAEKAFDKAEELGRKAMDSDAGKQVTETAKQVWSTTLGKNVAIGAGAGAALGMIVPGLGTIVGGVLGAGIGYLRTITKKS